MPQKEKYIQNPKPNKQKPPKPKPKQKKIIPEAPEYFLSLSLRCLRLTKIQ